jgi:hypothetical protein
MAFRADLIQGLLEAVVHEQRMKQLGLSTNPNSEGVFFFLANHLQQAVDIRMRGEQAQVFMEIDEIPQQDYVQWLRQPFPRLFIQMDKLIEFREYQGTLETHREPYTALVQAVLLLEYPRDERPTKIQVKIEVQRHEIERIFQAHFLMYERETLANTVLP